MPVIDCHVHLNYYSNIQKRKRISSLKDRLSELLETMSNNNIDYSIILTSYKFDIERPSTSHIIDILKNKDYKELTLPILEAVKAYNGEFISIFHNDNFNEGIKKFYKELIELAKV